MILVCPNCSCEYEVELDILQEKKDFKCSVCGFHNNKEDFIIKNSKKPTISTKFEPDITPSKQSNDIYKVMFFLLILNILIASLYVYFIS